MPQRSLQRPSGACEVPGWWSWFSPHPPQTLSRAPGTASALRDRPTPFHAGPSDEIACLLRLSHLSGGSGVGLLVGLGSGHREVSGPRRRPGRAEAKADENRACSDPRGSAPVPGLARRHGSGAAKHCSPAHPSHRDRSQAARASRNIQTRPARDRGGTTEHGRVRPGRDPGRKRLGDSGGHTGGGGHPSPGCASGPRALATLMLWTGTGVRAERSAPSRWPPQPQPQAQAGASSAPTATEVPGCAAVAAALYGRHSIWGNEIFAGQRFLER